MNKKSFGMAMAYVGCIVGAGFASGREILRFFNGEIAIVMMAVSALLIAYLAYIIVSLSHKYQVNGYKGLVISLFGQRFSVFINFAMLISYVITGAAMVSGAGQIFSDMGLGRLPIYIMCALCVVIASGGMKWIANSGIIIMTSFALINAYILIRLIGMGEVAFALGGAHQNGEALFDAVIYAGYNCALSLGVLCDNAMNKKEMKSFAVISGSFIFLLLIIIWMSMSPFLDSVMNIPMPMMYVVKQLGGLSYILLLICMLCGIISTLTAILHTTTEYFVHINKNIVIIAVMIISILIAQVGFAYIVDILYPFIGIMSVLILGRAIFVYYRRNYGIKTNGDGGVRGRGDHG